MAKIPEAKAGIVFRYRYLRIWQYARGEQTGKDRLCCLLFPLKPGQVITGTVFDEAVPGVRDRYEARSSDVIIVLIQSDRPGADQAGIELSLEEKEYIGLPADAPSYVIVSEVNVDRWPNGDMGLVPGRNTSFTYDRPLSRPTLSRVFQAFLRLQNAKRTQVLVRHP